MPYKDPEKRREANRRHNKKYYEDNPGRQIARNKERVRKTRDWLNEYKSSLFCSQCGENHPAALDFHHTDPNEKEYNIYYIAYMGLSMERVQKELAKCVVLCANCHRKLHWNEREAAVV